MSSYRFSTRILNQIQQIEPLRGGDYYPCAVDLNDGIHIDCVLIMFMSVQAIEWNRQMHVPLKGMAHLAQNPHATDRELFDVTKRARRDSFELVPAEIERVMESPCRTPNWLFDQINAVPEIAMGTQFVSLTTKAGDVYRMSISGGGFFLKLPDGVQFGDIIRVGKLPRGTTDFNLEEPWRFSCNAEKPANS